MQKILIDFSNTFVRTALLENGILKEFVLDDKKNKSIVSNIYVGVVKNILPSQFVFLDIGQDKNAFLQLNDKKETMLYDKKNNNKLKLKQGHEILIQVTKDSIGEKSACVSSQISFTGENLVLMSNVSGKEIGVSKKIENLDERVRLKSIIENNLPDGFGVIVRTKSEYKSDKELITELEQLLKINNDILEKSRYIKGPSVVREENHIVSRALKEIYNDKVEEIIINDEAELENIKKILETSFGKGSEKVKLHTEKQLLFNYYNLESIFNKLLHKKIWLKSGGFLIIEETEAFIIIDVNTGKFGGKKNHGETILKTNIEASIEICKQIKLRNLSGVIIIDFIAMKVPSDYEELTRIFSEELLKDRISTNIVGMTKLGLMQVTRKKIREPISNILMKECTCCTGKGKVVNESFVADRIYKDIDLILSGNFYNKITVKAAKKVLKFFDSDFYTKSVLEKKYNSIINLEQIEVGRIDYFQIEKERLEEGE